MILKAEQEKQALIFNLSQIIKELKTEEANERDLMDWSGEGNDRMVWRFTNEREIANRLVTAINVALRENFVSKYEVQYEKKPTIKGKCANCGVEFHIHFQKPKNINK